DQKVAIERIAAGEEVGARGSGGPLSFPARERHHPHGRRRMVYGRKTDGERIVAHLPYDVGGFRKSGEPLVERPARECMLAHEAAERRRGREPVRVDRTVREATLDAQLPPP